VSAVPRHSEEELRQQWAFLDALVDRQAASLKSGNQDPEEEDISVVAAAAPADDLYLEEISTLTRRVTTLESERATLLRRIDLAEEARMAAETGREAAEAARKAAERALADAQVREVPAPSVAPAEVAAVASAPAPVASAAPVPVTAPKPAVQSPPAVAKKPAPPVRKAPTSKSRRRSWWQRFRE
jgi:hypothetical protein